MPNQNVKRDFQNLIDESDLNLIGELTSNLADAIKSLEQIEAKIALKIFLNRKSLYKEEQFVLFSNTVFDLVGPIEGLKQAYELLKNDFSEDVSGYNMICECMQTLVRLGEKHNANYVPKSFTN